MVIVPDEDSQVYVFACDAPANSKPLLRKKPLEGEFEEACDPSSAPQPDALEAVGSEMAMEPLAPEPDAVEAVSSEMALEPLAPEPDALEAVSSETALQPLAPEPDALEAASYQKAHEPIAPDQPDALEAAHETAHDSHDVDSRDAALEHPAEAPAGDEKDPAPVQDAAITELRPLMPKGPYSSAARVKAYLSEARLS